jgi:glycosyltransferase involved in cell wall biosynthesis
MDNGRYRVLLLSSHPVQYSGPVFRRMAQHPSLDILVAYCSLQGAEPGMDPGFGVEVAWDTPLLEGYPWVRVQNRSLRPRLEHFFGLVNPGLWTTIRQGRFDALVAYTGYAYTSFWIALIAAKLRRIPVIFGTDASSIRPRDGKRWKIQVKKLLLPRIFRLADVVIVPSSAGRDYIRSLGIPDSRIVLTPFVVDNEWWRAQAERVDRAAVRASWGVPVDAPTALFCAKLQPWKRPLDVLRAFAQANVSASYLVFAGEGALRAQLEAEARKLGILERVRFLGFVNQSGLPSVYRSADLFVLSSEYDPCPAVVCEAMLCECPVVLSDQIRGRFDLVLDGETGFIYRCGDVDALAAILGDMLGDRERLRRMGDAARERMKTWTPEQNVEAFVEAVERAVRSHAPATTA